MKIFITGISSGIGKTLARFLLQQGHEVWGIARREELLIKLFEETGGKLRWSVCDVGDRKQLLEVREKMAKVNFTPQICILNAGVSRNDLDEPLNHNLSDELIGSNFKGVINCIEIYGNDVQKQKGQFILISSIFALMPDSRNPVYSAGKAGASMLARALRLNEKWRDVRFKNVYLGPIQTEHGRENKFYIPTIESTAKFIAGRVIPAGKNDFYYPFAAWLACRLFYLLSDGMFDRLTSSMRRK